MTRLPASSVVEMKMKELKEGILPSNYADLEADLYISGGRLRKPGRARRVAWGISTKSPGCRAFEASSTHSA